MALGGAGGGLAGERAVFAVAEGCRVAADNQLREAVEHIPTARQVDLEGSTCFVIQTGRVAGAVRRAADCPALSHQPSADRPFGRPLAHRVGLRPEPLVGTVGGGRRGRPGRSEAVSEPTAGCGPRCLRVDGPHPWSQPQARPPAHHRGRPPCGCVRLARGRPRVRPDPRHAGACRALEQALGAGATRWRRLVGVGTVGAEGPGIGGAGPAAAVLQFAVPGLCSIHDSSAMQHDTSQFAAAECVSINRRSRGHGRTC